MKYKTILLTATLAGFLAVGVFATAWAQVASTLMLDCPGMVQTAVEQKVANLPKAAQREFARPVGDLNKRMAEVYKKIRVVAARRNKLVEPHFATVHKRNPDFMKKAQQAAADDLRNNNPALLAELRKQNPHPQALNEYWGMVDAHLMADQGFLKAVEQRLQSDPAMDRATAAELGAQDKLNGFEALQVGLRRKVPLEWNSHQRTVDLTTDEFTRREKYTKEQIKAADIVEGFKQVVVVARALEEAAQGNSFNFKGIMAVAGPSKVWDGAGRAKVLDMPNTRLVLRGMSTVESAADLTLGQMRDQSVGSAETRRNATRPDRPTATGRTAAKMTSKALVRKVFIRSLANSLLGKKAKGVRFKPVPPPDPKAAKPKETFRKKIKERIEMIEEKAKEMFTTFLVPFGVAPPGAAAQAPQGSK